MYRFLCGQSFRKKQRLFFPFSILYNRTLFFSKRLPTKKEVLSRQGFLLLLESFLTMLGGLLWSSAWAIISTMKRPSCRAVHPFSFVPQSFLKGALSSFTAWGRSNTQLPV
jgi:hypothetical protein